MTNRYDLIKIQEKLQKKLTPDRYQHTLGVMYTCAALAMCHGCNLERAMVAVLLHDCAKCIPNDKKTEKSFAASCKSRCISCKIQI